MRYFFFILSLLICTSLSADFSSLLSSPQGNISPQVWSEALTSYMSQCSSGNCSCVLVVAEGITGDIKSANMWIGTFKGGMATELWSGYASRLATSNQNTQSVSKDTNPCKRRNGVASIKHGMACIPGRKCKDPSIYRNLADELGLPEGVALTSFYFSTPLQNEMYKFHDFYPCKTPPCPGTLGCLGLERHAMKSLCLNYMGSDGSNGVKAPENGGVWLYFHNMGAPSQNVGSESQAQLGFEKFEKAGLCSNIPSISLSSGEVVNGVDFSGGSSSSRSERGSFGGSAGNYMQLMQGTNQIVNDTIKQQQQTRGLPTISEQHKKFLESIQKSKETTAKSCITTTTKACPNVDSSTISQWCAKPEKSQRNGCKFNLGDS